MYGLSQEGNLENTQLSQLLTHHKFYTSIFTPGLWTHKHRWISFILYVDDFGIKYENNQDLHFLLNILQPKYKITIYWSGKLFCGFTFQWSYSHNRCVKMSIPNYIHNLLQTIQHPTPHRQQHSPYIYTYSTNPKHTQLPTP